MFTGLVATLGSLHLLSDQLVQISCNMSSEPLWQDLAIGDSVSVDGICLTVTELLPNGFTAAISPETVSRTILQWSAGSNVVNLEPSLRVGSKLGGHFVTGHIDGIGYLETAIQTANAWEMSFQVPDSRVSRYIVPKGSIAVNGVSLTVAECNATGSWFKVAVIPLTYAETNLHDLQPGSPVNLEGDVLGKYVEKFLRLHAMTGETSFPSESMAVEAFETTIQGSSTTITPAFLAEHGYL